MIFADAMVATGWDILKRKRDTWACNGEERYVCVCRGSRHVVLSAVQGLGRDKWVCSARGGMQRHFLQMLFKDADLTRRTCHLLKSR